MHMILGMQLLRVLPVLTLALVAVAGIHAEVRDGAVPPVQSTTAAAPHPKRVGGAVSAPTLIHVVDMPGLAHTDSELVLNLWVETNGEPSHIRVLQGSDPSENEKIIAAVSQYRFAPAMENGKPVLVEMNLALSVD